MMAFKSPSSSFDDFYNDFFYTKKPSNPASPKRTVEGVSVELEVAKDLCEEMTEILGTIRKSSPLRPDLESLHDRYIKRVDDLSREIIDLSETKSATAEVESKEIPVTTPQQIMDFLVHSRKTYNHNYVTFDYLPSFMFEPTPSKNEDLP